MSPNIITFEKSYEQRFDEYNDILGTRGHLSASEVQREWCYYIETVLEPTGWQAVWKMSRQKCQDFNIEFPTLTFVMVKRVDFGELDAVVDVVAVQDSISIPEEHTVPLVNLYPTKQQENELCSIDSTANCLDQLRFFYNHLWRPWDYEDDNQDWLSAHLETRLMLYYDMKSGVVLHETGQHIRSLLHKMKEIERKICALQEQFHNDGCDEIAENAAYIMLQLQTERDKIKREIEILENPEMRMLVVKKKQEVMDAKRHSQEACLVWLGGTVDEFIRTLGEARSVIQPEVHVRCYPILQGALDQAVPGSSIVLCPGIHEARDTGCLEEGGTMKGFLEPSVTTVRAQVAGNVLLDWSANSMLENLTVDAQAVQVAVSVRHGSARLRKCRIVGRNANSTGILVFRDCTLEAHSCEFLNFGIGIMLKSGAQASLVDCIITSCGTGIKVNEGASLTLQRCKISGCSEYGVKVEISDEVENGMQGQHMESAVMMKRNLKLEETVIEGNTKGDVCTVQQRGGVPYESDDDSFLH